MRGDSQARTARLLPAPVRGRWTAWHKPGRRWRHRPTAEELELIERLGHEARQLRRTGEFRPTPPIARPWY